jgi:hypothetical protein
MREEESMKTRDGHIDKMLGYLGLFIIGTLGWTSDRLGDLRTAWPRLAPRAKTSHAIERTNA